MAALTTSGTYTYSQSATDLVSAALRAAQVIGDEDTPTGAQMANALEAFAAMIKGWQGSGIHVWCEEECILFLQPGQPVYSLGAGSTDHACLFSQMTQVPLVSTALAGASSVVLGTPQLGAVPNIAVGDNFGVQLDAGTNFWTTVSSVAVDTIGLTVPLPSQASAGAITFDYTTPLGRPLKVMGGRRFVYQSLIDTPVLMWARLDYQAQPNKYTPGVTTAFFYDPQTGQGAYSNVQGQMNAWPNPQNNTFGLRFTAQRPIQDLGSLANLPDFPVEWLPALKWNLGARDRAERLSH